MAIFQNGTYGKILGFFVVFASFILMIFLGFKAIPPENRDIFTLGLGVFLAMAKGIVHFNFGSSEGSKAKTELLNVKKKRFN